MMKSCKHPQLWFWKFICRIGFCFFCLSIIFFIADLAYTRFLERILPLRTEVYLQMFETSIHQRSDIEGLFYELKPNSEKGHLKINSFGMRDNESRLLKDYYRILVMGDSVTFGSEQEKDRVFTEIAERILNADGKKIEILNAAVSGYNTRQEFIALREKYIRLHPDLVIFAYCVNDSGEAAIQYLPEGYIHKGIQKLGIKLEKMWYTNLSPAQYLSLALPKQFFLNYDLDRWLLLNSGIYRAVSILKFKTVKGIKNLKDIPNFLFAFDFNKVLMDIKKLSAEHGFSVRFMILPVNTQWNKDDLIRSLADAGISFYDFDLSVRKAGAGDDSFWLKDGIHLSSKGHLLVGQMLAGELHGTEKR